MPRNDAWSQNVPYPVLADAPDIEIATQGIVNGIVPLTVMRFANANARAAALTGATAPVPGMITYLKAEDRWEARQADNTWLLLSDGPWTPLVFSSGFSAHGGSPGWRKKAGGGIELRGLIKKNSGSLNDTGDPEKFGALPGAIAPAANRHFLVASSRATISSVTRMSARLIVASNGDLTYFCENGGGAGTVSSPAWLSLDGIQFSPAGD